MAIFPDGSPILKLCRMGTRWTSLTAHSLGKSRLLSYADCANSMTHSPICPQVSTDFHHLLRIPEDVKAQEPPVSQDEFECLNLDITVPSVSKSGMPVLIWIHGTF